MTDELIQRLRVADADTKAIFGEDFVSTQGEAANEIERLRAEVAANKYVPGTWCCPKCKFVLVQSNLNANTGTITARDEPGTKCPNCDTPLWRTTWRDEAIEMGKRCEEQVLRAIEAESALAALRKRVDESFAVTLDRNAGWIGAPNDLVGKRVALVVLGEG